MEEALQDIYQEFQVTEMFVEDWLSSHQNDPIIKGYFEKLENLEHSVFNQNEQKIEYIPCKDMPQGLNEDMYILIYRKQ
jgi:hypothetical protein